MAKGIGIIVVAVVGTAWGWTTPVNVGPGVNTSGEESDPGISPDGNTLYFSSSRAGGYGGYDIYYSPWTGSGWGNAINIGSRINTSYIEAEPALYQSTYLELYFSTNRPGGAGSTNIWMSQYRSSNWITATYCGAPPNSGSGEGEPFLIASPTRIFFSSNRASGSGGYDIWVSTYSGGWGTPVNLGTGVNTGANEYGPTLNSDGRYLYFGSDRSGGYGSYDIYRAVFTGSTWGNTVNLGPPVNTSAQEGHPCITGNNQRLYFSSNRSGGYGGGDVWYTYNQTNIAPTSFGKVKVLFR
jgi:Tol biopolymer transport system component